MERYEKSSLCVIYMTGKVGKLVNIITNKRAARQTNSTFPSCPVFITSCCKVILLPVWAVWRSTQSWWMFRMSSSDWVTVTFGWEGEDYKCSDGGKVCRLVEIITVWELTSSQLLLKRTFFIWFSPSLLLIQHEQSYPPAFCSRIVLCNR